MITAAIDAPVAQTADIGRAVAVLGRFGHKAGTATLRHQAAKAFPADLGLSTPRLPDPRGGG